MGARRWMFVTDTHGDKVDQGAAKVALDFEAWFRPEIRIHGGDACDFAWLRKNAGEEDKDAETMKADVEAACHFMDAYRPTHFIEGNHDKRAREARESSRGAVKALAAEFHKRLRYVVEDVHHAEVFEWGKRKGVMRLGDYALIHGYASGLQATRQHAQVYGNVIHGHLHRSQTVTVPRMGDGSDVAVGHSVGCLCQLDLGYNDGHLQTLQQQHGFAYGWLHEGGMHEPPIVTVYNVTPDRDGRWRFPTEERVA